MGRDANGSRWEPGLAAGVKAEKLRNRMWKYFVCSFVSFLPLVNMQGSNQEIGFRLTDRLGVDPIYTYSIYNEKFKKGRNNI